MKKISVILILISNYLLAANISAQEPIKKPIQQPVITPAYENKKVPLQEKKFIIKSIYINQSIEDFKNLKTISESNNFKCVNDNNKCFFESTLLGSKAYFEINFVDSKINEIFVSVVSEKEVIEPAFNSTELSDYLNSEYGTSENNTEDFDMKSWLDRYLQIFTTYTCTKENSREPEFIRNGCIVDGLRKLNFGFNQSIMMNGKLNIRISSYKWKTKEEVVSYEKVRGKYHPKIAPFFKNNGFSTSGNWDFLIINQPEESKFGFINKKLKYLFSEEFFDGIHDKLEKEIGVKIRPTKPKKSDF